MQARIEFIDTPGRSSTDKHASVDAVTTAPFDKKLVVEPSVNAPGKHRTVNDCPFSIFLQERLHVLR